MIKSASKNSAAEQRGRDKSQVTAIFLVVQAVLLMCLLIYFYVDLALAASALALAWAFASLALAALLLRGRFLAAEDSALLGSGDGAHIFGLPGNNLDLASLCAMLQEGAALLKNGCIIYVNPALAYLLAAQEEEILGTRLAAYLHPEDAGLLNLGGASRPGEGPSRAALRLLTRLGDTRWVICSAHNVDWQDEEALLLLFENIGPLRQAQQDLKTLEHQSRILLERTPLGVAMFDAMGRLRLSNTAWNALWSGIVGNSGRRFNILQDPFLPNTPVEQAVRQAFAKQDSGINNFEHAAPWGETRWLNLNFHPMTDPLGKLIGVAMIQQDITDRIRSTRRENELNEQLAALRRQTVGSGDVLDRVLDAAPHALVIFGPDGLITGWNRRAEARFGLPARQALGLHWRELPADFSLYRPLLREALGGGPAREFELMERFDEHGPHYERVRVKAVRAGAEELFALCIEDVGGRLLEANMNLVLRGFSALSGLSRALEADPDAAPNADPDVSGVPPAPRPGGEPLDKLAPLLEFLRAQDWPGASRRNAAVGELLEATGAVLDAALAARTARTGRKAASLTECAAPEAQVFTDPALAASGLAGLAVALLDLCGEEPDLLLRQFNTGGHAAVLLRVAAGDPDGLTNLAGLAARLEGPLPGLEEHPAARSVLGPLRELAAAGGVVGGYSHGGYSGFVCRFRLSGPEGPLSAEG